MIKSYYEVNSENQLETEMNNFKTGLYRNSVKHCQINEMQKTTNLHFVKILSKILHPKTPQNFNRIEAITQELVNTPTADRKWLLDKLEALKPQ